MNIFEFINLPYDLQTEVLLNTDYPTLRRLCMTNREMRKICNTERGRDILNYIKNRYEELTITPPIPRSLTTDPLTGLSTIGNLKPQIGTLISRIKVNDFGTVATTMLNSFHSSTLPTLSYDPTHVVIQIDPKDNNLIVKPIREIKGDKVYMNSDLRSEIVYSEDRMGIRNWVFGNGDLVLFSRKL